MDTSTTVCQICFEEAKPNQLFQIHYGAISCMSCKAFFRRCHQENSKLSTFKCKNQSRCDLRVIKRHQCKKCRYSRCLAVGMNPEAVLKGEDRIKFTHASKRPCPALSTSPASPDAESSSSSSLITSRSSDQDTCVALPKPMKFMMMYKRRKKSDSFQAQDILTKFTMAEAEVDIDPFLVEKVIKGHKNPQLWDGSHTNSVLLVIGGLRQMIAHFVQKSTLFQSLSAEDQTELLVRNGNLYIQFIAAEYLNGKDAYSQISTLLGPNMPILDEDQIDQKPISFERLNSQGQFVSLEDPLKVISYHFCCLNMCFLIFFSKVDKFLQCVRYIGKGFNNPGLHRGLLLNFILFNTKNRDLEEFKRIQAIQEVSKELIDPDVRLSQLIDTLMIMVEFSTSFMSPTSWQQSIMLPMTNEEQILVLNCIHLYRDAMKVIRPDESYAYRFIQMMLGNPEHGERVHREGLALFHARFQVILDKLTDFQTYGEDRIRIVQANYELAVNLNVAKLNNLKSLKDQVLHLVGTTVVDLDDETKAVDVLNATPSLPKYGSDISRLRDLSRQMGCVVKQDDVYILTMLSILLNNTSNRRIQAMHQLVTRRLMHYLNEDFSFSQYKPEHIYNALLRNLTEFIAISKSYMSM